jgi:hypothetical protein
MRRGSMLAIVGIVMTAAMFSQSASAATAVGNSCAGNRSTEEEQAVVSLANGGGSPAAIPVDGVITSWTFNVITVPPGFLSMQLKVFRPTSVPGQLQVVGESALTPVSGGTNTFLTRIPVKTGDLIGNIGLLNTGAESGYRGIYCESGTVGGKIGVIAGNPITGATVPIKEETPEAGDPITVTVEPDADGDGYGDETQDKCPTDASTQGPCPVKAAPPAPTPPITLSASGAAKKGLVTVTVTSSAQASVTLAGTVKLGKGKSVTLSGGTQTVTPGSLAKFVVLFPAKLKARLKQLPPAQKLSLSLTASAPGATSTSLTVNVKGQKKSKPRQHPKG